MPPRQLTMPKLSDSMADAVILRWLKAAGEAFERGEGLIEVETDKATVIYEAEWDGTLDSILAPEGATVGVGEPIATLANGDGAAGRRGTAGAFAARAAGSALRCNRGRRGESRYRRRRRRDVPSRRRSRAGLRSSSASPFTRSPAPVRAAESPSRM